MIGQYQPLPDYQRLIVNAPEVNIAAVELSNAVYVVGYQEIDFWVEITGATTATSVAIKTKCRSLPGQSSLFLQDDIVSDDNIANGAWNAFPNVGTFPIVAGTNRFLLTQQAVHGLTMSLVLTFDAADAGASWAVYAARRP